MRDDVFIPYTLVFVCGADLVPRAVDDLAEGTLAHGVLPLEVELVGGAVIVLATVHAEVDCKEVRVWAFDRDYEKKMTFNRNEDTSTRVFFTFVGRPDEGWHGCTFDLYAAHSLARIGAKYQNCYQKHY